MKLGVLFSSGKDSCYAAYLANNLGYKISCLITIISENKESYMFHTPSVTLSEHQSKLMKIPFIKINTKGKKEKELDDLKKAIEYAIKKYKIKGIVTGAIESVYQASRIQRICNELKIDCFNPLWQKNQLELIEELIKNNFEIVITGVFAYPLNKSWLGRKIDKEFIEDIKKVHDKYQINISGEGGEYESLVVNCPLFSKKLEIKDYKDIEEKNSWVREMII
jgi:diphthine-ammonia ligase